MIKLQKCILCGNGTKKMQKINVSEIISIYKAALDTNIGSHFLNRNFVNFYRCLNCNLRFFDPDTAGNDLFYEELQEIRKSYYNTTRIEFIHALKHISKNAKVLEIGSGDGYFAEKIDKKNYVGLEFNDRAIKIASKKGVTLKKNTIEDYVKKYNKKFDIVCSFHVLEHVDDPYSFIKHSIESLKIGGKLILAVPCNDSLITSNYNHTLNLPPHHISRFYISTFKQIEKMFEEVKLVNQYIYDKDFSTVKRDYDMQYLTNKILGVFYPKRNAVINPFVYHRTKQLMKRLNLIFKITDKMNIKYYSNNMTFVFEKIDR